MLLRALGEPSGCLWVLSGVVLGWLVSMRVLRSALGDFGRFSGAFGRSRSCPFGCFGVPWVTLGGVRGLLGALGGCPRGSLGGLPRRLL